MSHGRATVKLILSSNCICPYGRSILRASTPMNSATFVVHLCYHTEILKAKAPSRKVDFVLEPKSKYYDPLEKMFPESEVE